MAYSFKLNKFVSGYRTISGDHLNNVIDSINGGFIDSKGTLAAAGSTAADAGLVTKTITSVTASDATKGVILTAGMELAVVYNSVAANGLKIYPPSGCNFNGGTADVAITIEGKTVATLRLIDTTTYAATYTADT